MTAWLATVSAEHVRRGVALGIAQVDHGRRTKLASMHAGDGFVYYSPRERMGDGPALRAFTAAGILPDDEIWQADDGDFHPFRRRCDYVPDARPVPLDEIRDRLELVRRPNWGHSLRRGLVPLDDDDFAAIRESMGA